MAQVASRIRPFIAPFFQSLFAEMGRSPAVV
jgi:hypothetical protein